MEPFEVMISESQERMLCVVAPERLDEVLALCAPLGGARHADRRRSPTRAGCACSTATSWWATCRWRRWWTTARSTTSSPRRRPSRSTRRRHGSSPTTPSRAETLLALLRSPSIASKRWAFEQYDSIVGSRTVRRPEAADAAVLSARAGRRRAAPSRCRSTATAGGWPAIRTRARSRRCSSARANLACVGAEPLGLTNCLNFGNPEKPHIAWQLTRAVEGLAAACEALGVPVVGGNVSLYNEGGGGPIYPTPVVGMVGQLPDPAARGRHRASRAEGDQIALLGPFRPALAGSELEKLRGALAGGLPDVDLELVRTPPGRCCARPCAAAGSSSAHDVSEGGLACALAECCMAGGIGARVDSPRCSGGCRTAAPATRRCSAREPAASLDLGPARDDRRDLPRRPAADGLLRLGEVGGESLELTAGIATLSSVGRGGASRVLRAGFPTASHDSHGAHRVPRRSSRRVRGLRRLRAGVRRRAPRLLRPVRAAAPRPGVRGHRHLRRRPHHGRCATSASCHRSSTSRSCARSPATWRSATCATPPPARAPGRTPSRSTARTAASSPSPTTAT